MKNIRIANEIKKIKLKHRDFMKNMQQLPKP